jgi:uncharacterized protein (TIGR02611 family)
VGPEEDETPRQWADRSLEQASKVYERHGRVFRTLWVVCGAVVVVVGIAMVVFPGPSTIVVPVGLVLLAAAFGWARRLLLKAVEEGAEAKERFDDLSAATRALTVLASVCLAAAVTTWMVL